MKSRSHLFVWLALILAATPSVGIADVTRETRRFHIPAQELGEALRVFGRESGAQLVFDEGAVRGKRSSAVAGELSVDEALDQLLAGSGLLARRGKSGVLVIGPIRGADLRSTPDLRLTQAAGRSAAVSTAQSTSAAADQSAEESARNSPELQEIVVTATKRAVNIRDVPLSIAAISADDIERRGLVHAEDYLRGIPGVNQVTDGYGQSIVIRGVESSPQYQNFGAGGTTATYFGETPTTSSGGWNSGSSIDIKLVDIERVEVLRGPQGTAFGSSAMGGAVRTIPAAPKLDRFEGSVGIKYSVTSGQGSDNNMVQAVGNVPIVENRFAVRAVAYRGEDSGYYRNIAGSDPAAQALYASLGALDYAADVDDVGAYYFVGGRLAALYQANEDLKITLSYLTQTNETDGFPIATRPGFDQVVALVAPPHVRRGQRNGSLNYDIDIANAMIDYDLGWANVFATYSHLKSKAVESVNENLEVDYNLRSTLVNFRQRGNIGELRLATRLEGPWNFLVGVYTEDTSEDGGYDRYWVGSAAADFRYGVAGPQGYYLNERTLEQRAAFGEVSWKFLPALTLTVGARAYEYERNYQADSVNPLTPPGAFHTDDTSDASGTSFRANLGYKPNENALLFATWSQGFRLGRPQPQAADYCDVDSDGIIDGTSVSVASTGRINSDEVDNVEVGGRFSLLERRLTIDAGIYRMRWSGIPAFVYVPLPPQSCGWGYITNAGRALSEGAELQASFQVTEAIRVDIGGSYLKARLTDDVPAEGFRAGDPLPGAPKTNANLGVEYGFRIGGYNASVRADAVSVGEFYGDILRSPNTRSGDYIKLDASARVAIGNLSVDVFARNLTNEDAFTFRGAYGYVVDSYGSRMRPRTVGVQLGYRF